MKNTTTTMKWLVVLTIAGVFTVTSCKKKTTEETPTPTTTTADFTAAAEDNSYAESSSDEMTNMADEAVDGNLTSYKDGSVLSHCATLTFERMNPQNDDTVTITFSNADCSARTCMSHDGKYRSGSIRVIHSRMHKYPGAHLFVEPVGYCVNGNEVRGKREVYRLEVNPDTTGDGYIKDSIHVAGSIILANGGGTVTWNSDRTRKWMFGKPSNLFDDIVEITGSASGTSAKGVTFGAVIETTLVRQFCLNTTISFKNLEFVSGIVALSKDGIIKRRVDFGNGTCDGKASIYDENGTFIREVDLRK